MSEPTGVELFIIGNEILIGDILDTNTNWLCKQINSLGGQVLRATVLRDNCNVIAAEIHAALLRGTEVIITSGGLGPTADDLTLAAVAQGAGLETRLHVQACQMVKESYDDMASRGILALGGLNPAREKMAWLPVGASPLHNPVGTAPGVLLQTGKSTIISLPGVPSELKGIFSTSLQQFLHVTFHGGFSVAHTITVACNDESVMEPVLSKVTSDHPDIYIKSLATTLGESPEIDITLSAVGSAQDTLDKLLSAALHDLKTGLSALGIGHTNK
jgi:molybdenum cofactor synthesis domain-containing protein